jgi:2-oxoglutarate ferredoxin oxidoreductase subunit delta
MSQIVIHTERCKKCGVCIGLCPRDVYAANDEGCPEPVHADKCSKCGLCELWCPDYAIELEV